MKFILTLIVAMTLSMGSALAGDVTGTGSFTGKSGHKTSGMVTIEKTADGYAVILQDDFLFDGAPDPKVVIGRQGNSDRITLAHLAENSGKQSYPIPANIDVSQYDEVWIWCKRYAVPLGYASLK